VINQALQLTSRVVCSSAGTVLIKGTDGGILALGTGQLYYNLISSCEPQHTMTMTVTMLGLGDSPPEL
jgi:hypothetical protein